MLTNVDDGRGDVQPVGCYNAACFELTASGTRLAISKCNGKAFSWNEQAEVRTISVRCHTILGLMLLSALRQLDRLWLGKSQR